MAKLTERHVSYPEDNLKNLLEIALKPTVSEPNLKRATSMIQRMLCGDLVYLLHAVGTNRYKIGYTHDIDKRMAALKSACPEPLALVCMMSGGRRREQILHRLWEEERIHGEWFALEDEDVEEIKCMAKEQDWYEV